MTPNIPFERIKTKYQGRNPDPAETAYRQKLLSLFAVAFCDCLRDLGLPNNIDVNPNGSQAYGLAQSGSDFDVVVMVPSTHPLAQYSDAQWSQFISKEVLPRWRSLIGGTPLPEEMEVIKSVIGNKASFRLIP